MFAVSAWAGPVADTLTAIQTPSILRAETPGRACAWLISSTTFFSTVKVNNDMSSSLWVSSLRQCALQSAGFEAPIAQEYTTPCRLGLSPKGQLLPALIVRRTMLIMIRLQPHTLLLAVS